MKVKGLSLVELMIVTVIISVGLVSVVRMEGVMMGHRSFYTQQKEAIYLAKSQIATFRSYDAITTGTGTLAYEDITSGSGTVTVGNTTYTRTWTVSENTTLKIKNITVTVSWTTQTGTSASVTLRSIIAEVNK